MKISKSIVFLAIFCIFFKCFFFALHRTNGNALKSLKFALYYLAIKIGLISPNVDRKFNEHQPNQQLVSIERFVQSLPLSILDNYHPSGLYMENIQGTVQSHYVSDHSQSVINELRAGDERLKQAAYLFITIWMLQYQSQAFQPVNYSPLPLHIESARNLLFGKPKPDKFSSRRSSMFDSGQSENNKR